MRLKLLPDQENVPLEDKLCGDYQLVSEIDGFNGRTVNRNVLINTVSINSLDEELSQAEINMQTKDIEMKRYQTEFNEAKKTYTRLTNKLAADRAEILAAINI